MAVGMKDGMVNIMNKSKVLEFFDASREVKAPIHIIGCGAIGSHVAEQLTRLGCTNIHLWDFDKVEPKNITNQMFMHSDIGKDKVDAVESMMKNINEEIAITKHPKGICKPYIVNGYVFLCVDNIDLRREIVKANENNPNCICFHDFRMRLTDAQYYFAERGVRSHMENLLASMNFSHEEAVEATPKSACGVELNVIYTVKNIVTYGMQNFVQFCRGAKPKNTILTDMNFLSVDVFEL